MAVVLDHAVGIDAEAGLADGLRLQVCPDVHAGGIPPEEERLVRLLRLLEVVQRGLRDLVVDGLHPLLSQRAGALDFLRAVRIRPGVDHAARLKPLDHRRVLEVVLVLELFLGVEVIERAHELVEAVRGREVLVEVAEMVFAELRGHVALCPE